MFLVLGLLVNPKELLPIAVLGLIIGAFMVIFSRPISVMLSLLPFRKLSFNARAYVSWVGLRGAVPIIFATYPLVAGTPHAIEMFNIVFFITLVSLIVQGSTIPLFAKLSSLCHRNEETKKSDFGFDIEFPEEVKSAMSEVKITGIVLRTEQNSWKFRFPINHWW
jgi:cell volume regulation protein A